MLILPVVKQFQGLFTLKTVVILLIGWKPPV